MDGTQKDNLQVLNVPIEDIIPNRFQPRLSFDENALKELATSIKEHGIIQPLVLRRLGEKYEIIAGERRYKAAKMAGLTKVPAIISNMDDKSSAEVAIVENVQRKDLTSIEEAKSYKALLDKGYLTQEELAKKMGLSQSNIANKLRLLSLSKNVQDAIIEGKISERHARSLLQLPNEEEQDKWLNKIIEERLTVKELDMRIKNMDKEKDNKTIENNDVNEKAKEETTPKVDSEKQYEDIIPKFFKKQNETNIPNKFFNFLEDEEANMSMSEDGEEEKKAPEPEEEIELLDFDISSVNNPTLEVVEIPNQDKPIIDLAKAKDIVKDAENNLKNNNFIVNIESEENANELKYSITIKTGQE